ncbi:MULTISPECIES: adenosylcobinamide-phosphate synthase CbiB [Metabacillus]|uniref:adenosylcobinamide-phosphate synthase CbiB n=1 Tax=Metabacillus TaxID=2675233 RepID=UPI000EF5FB7E|nr:MULTISPECIES: adenosylcobinamide-phosphate synthase CbiB [Metabacillus]MCM3409421.1 adenosylcobinamide-phosphate synthase CbiB [Metabacillus litoralis]UGB33007.1 adenosylcobinamide-phosphate synthase CbiB [Metabacillus sp. B2-18]UHA58983.1 adenosylcobinamide-phosphate synthase CbiB [Metabacillus litoralis]
MLTHSIMLVFSYLIDRFVGDPRSLPHPVIYIGKGISLLEKLIRKFFHDERKLKVVGLLFPIVIVGLTYLLTVIILIIAHQINNWLAICIEIWLISTTIATKGLADAGREVYKPLQEKDLPKARKSLGMIVGRDTDFLDENEISRGTIETVAENIVDAIISPLFFALIGGAPLAMAYRAVNTLDSMVGYKNEKYQNLGWASARLDDICNYIPARITAVLILAACWIVRLDIRAAWSSIKNDAKLHPSPNSGIPEAAVAGALGIQLGGTNYYNGMVSHRAKMGVPKRNIEANDILHTIKIMHISSMIGLIIFFILSIFMTAYVY